MNDVITDHQINKWKFQYKEIFRVVINGDTYIYRVLTIGECQDIQSKYLNDQIMVENYVLDNCILYPENYNSKNSTLQVIRALVDYIVKSTKFFNPDDLKELLEKAKASSHVLMETDFFVWSYHIMQNLHGYTLDILRKLTPLDFFELVYICETLSGNKLIGPMRKKGSKPDPQLREKNVTVKHIPNEHVSDKKVRIKSDDELTNISINESTLALEEHWRKIKSKKKNRSGG